MSVILNRVERMNPLTKVKKWYAVLRTIEQTKESMIAKQISEETTLNRKEAEMAMSQLEKVLISNLMASRSVQLGDWGSFYLTCNSEGFNRREDVTANAVKKLNIRFVAGKALRNALKEASFVFAEDLVTKQATEDEKK